MNDVRLSMDWSLVGRTSLDVRPLADEVLSSRCEGERIRIVSEGDAVWQTYGPRHNLRVTTRGRFSGLAETREFFLVEREKLASAVGVVEGALMGTGMHPWFEAARVEPWPHGGAKADETMHRLFHGARHGWANQMPLGLAVPFASEAEFALRFAVLRFLLPLLPALSAASPMAEGAIGPARQCRAGARHDFFCAHPDFAKTSVQRHVPPVIPSLAAHASLVEKPLTTALVASGAGDELRAGDVYAGGLWPLPKEGLIEVRLLDGQESVSANIALCALVDRLCVELACNTGVADPERGAWPAARLDELVRLSIVEGERAILRDAEYLGVWGFPEGGRCRVQDLVQYLWEDKLVGDFDEALRPFAETIVMKGCLASRILRALPPRWNREALFVVYRDLVGCLRDDTGFGG